MEEDNDLTTSTQYIWKSNTKSWQQQHRTLEIQEAQLQKSDAYDWDTLTNTWVHISAFVNEFDDAGNQTLMENRSFNREEQVWYGSREIWGFDAEDRLVEYRYATWMDQVEWSPESRYTQQLTAEGNILERSNYVWNPRDESWELYSRETYTYSPDGLPVLWEKAFPDNSSGELLVLEKRQQAYDPEGNLSVDEYFRLNDSNQWEVRSWVELSYNGLSELTLKETHEWDYIMGSLFLQQTDSFAYTSGRNVAATYTLNYDPFGDVTYGRLAQSEYDGENRRVLSIVSDWDLAKDDWILRRKTESPYNSIGKVRYYAGYDWNEQVGKWVGRGKTGFDYGPHGLADRTYKCVWSLSRDDWTIVSTTMNEYGPCNTDNIIPAGDELAWLYPSPAVHSWVYLESKAGIPLSYEVFDLQGRRILRGELNAVAEPLILDNLSNGTYVIYCMAGERSEIKKFIIARL